MPRSLQFHGLQACPGIPWDSYGSTIMSLGTKAPGMALLGGEEGGDEVPRLAER